MSWTNGSPLSSLCCIQPGWGAWVSWLAAGWLGLFVFVFILGLSLCLCDGLVSASPATRQTTLIPACNGIYGCDKVTAVMGSKHH